MGRNIDGLTLTAKESSDLAYEWTISDLMEDEENRLKKLLNSGSITRDEYLDGIDNLRETAEIQYEREFAESLKEESYGYEESDWDYMQEYAEAF